MRKRQALQHARAFVRRAYPEFSNCSIDVALEEDGERCKSWSFGVRIDKEDLRYEPGALNGFVGYVHASGYVEGLY